ncbi:MAG: ribosomal L7Ae/L30e/S12e/Gadd45 family protein [Candidatus Aenigmatarchaeota archaeon]
MSYVNFEVPEDLEDQVFEAVDTARATGKADLVIIAEDVNPPEVVMHLAPICEEKDIPYVYVKEKEDLGRACGIGVQSASASITDVGDAEGLVEEIVDEVKTLKTES